MDLQNSGRFEKIKRTGLYIALDAILINLSILIALSLWYGGSIPGGGYITFNADVWLWYAHIAVFTTVAALVVYTLFGFYSKIWQYTDIDELIKIFISQVIIFLLLYIFDRIFLRSNNYIDLPRRMLALGFVLNTFFFVFSRSGYRFLKRMMILFENRFLKKTGMKRVMIIGAGFGGFSVVRSILRFDKGYENRLAVIIVDDDKSKNNTTIHGVRVTYNIENVPRLAEEYEIDEIIIAIPSANNIQLKRIMSYCQKTSCTLKIIPPVRDVSEGGGFQRVMQDVKIADLLFRDEVDINIRDISGYLSGKTVLVTGGGGSIGSELCRQIAGFSPKLLVIFDVYENNAYELYHELKNKYGDRLNIIIVIGTICDRDIVDRVFKVYSPQVVFHAAAHKHVPLMQNVPREAMKNNVFGTINVAEAADRYGVERFVLLSTDKAVNPTNIMGASKRITEMIIQRMAKKSKTRFMAVRFGNVLGSNGSVVNLFKRQIEEGGPVRVTHKDITRYFMTIPEAARLVLQAGSMGVSGSIFVLDMGEPVRINDLAENLIKLSGYKPYKDIDIVYTGLRPGDKLFEELVMESEKDSMERTEHKKIFIAKPEEVDPESFDRLIERLRTVCEKGGNTLGIIKELVPNFNNTDNGNNTEIIY